MKFNYIIIILLFVSLKSLCQISLPTFQGIHSGESCEIINNGLTIHYDVGNPNSYSGSGTRLVDLSGNGHDAILRNNLHNGYNNGVGVIVNGFFTFNGSNHYAYIESLNINNTISEMSVFAWVKTTYNSGTPGVWGEGNWSIIDFDRSEKFQLTISNAGEVAMAGNTSDRGNIGISSGGGFSGQCCFDIVANTRVNDGEWHYVGYTFSVSNQEIIFYVDGVVDKTYTADGTMTALGTAPTSRNRYGFLGDGSEASSQNGGRNGIYFDGAIAAIHYYRTKLLSPSEVYQNYCNMVN